MEIVTKYAKFNVTASLSYDKPGKAPDKNVYLTADTGAGHLRIALSEREALELGNALRSASEWMR